VVDDPLSRGFSSLLGQDKKVVIQAEPWSELANDFKSRLANRFANPALRIATPTEFPVMLPVKDRPGPLATANI
jgi:hypothetical protein